jgi:predicted CoA-binding protein
MKKTGSILTEGPSIKGLFKTCKTIAVLGLSANPQRDSHRVAQYLKRQGYRIVPVHPLEKEILGEKVFKSLDEIDEPLDMIDVFRKSEAVFQHARQAIRLKPKVFWMQLGIVNQDAADILMEAGIDVVMNKCTKVEHARLCSKDTT